MSSSSELISATKEESILVAIRVRKLLKRETSNVWKWSKNDNQIYQEQGGGKKFGFDKVFTPSDTNEDVYSELIAPRIASVVQGFNSTIFAYGQTASGKTHTMLGTDSEPGVIWRSVNSIFDQGRNSIQS